MSALRQRLLAALSATGAVGAMAAGARSATGASTNASATASAAAGDMVVRKYTPRHTAWPYTQRDMTPIENGNDGSFYKFPRFVAHIDEPAIAALTRYYADALPRKGRVLDFCSSWISHYPADFKRRPSDGEKAETAEQAVEVVGYGMNKAELAGNPILSRYAVQDLNVDPEIRESDLAASTCTVSIDYLTKPVAVLSSIRAGTVAGGSVHLAVSNRCFPTKVVSRWLNVDEEERLLMVADYLHFAGWTEIEILQLKQGGWSDPLWIVRGRNGNPDDADRATGDGAAPLKGAAAAI